MSIQQNFPAITPSLSLNFARSKKLDPRITFTRTSSATRINETGLVEVVPANAPRFDHSYDPVSGSVRSLGLLVEESRTNNIQVSAPAPADISKSSNQEGWLTQIPELVYTSVLGPDGNNNAINVNLTSILGSNFAVPFIYTQQSLLANNNSYTLSFWVDASDLVEVSSNHLTIIIGTNSFSSSSGRYFRINFNKNTNNFSSVNYVTGSSITAENSETIFPSESITSRVTEYPNNYKRIQVTFKLENYDGFYDSGNTLADFRFSYGIYMGVPGSTNSNVGRNLKTWGWQLEQGSFPTSYIPTTNSTVTRTADNVSMVGENFSSWYNQSEGTFYTSSRISRISSTPGCGVYYLNDGTTSNYISIFYRASGSTGFLLSNNNISIVDTSPTGVLTENQNLKISSAYKINDIAISTNGMDVVTATPNIIPNINRLVIGEFVNYLNGHIAQLTYYPRRLSNTQLQNLTK
jgi:hypothetical protein